MKSLIIEEIEINEKPIYIFEDHSLAFKAWLDIKNKSKITPFVVTLDHHTDTRKPLCNFGAKEKMQSKEIISFEESYNRTLEIHFKKLNIDDEAEVNDFLVKLHHDEHISSAIQKGIINYSISIQWDDNSGTYSVEEDECHNQPTLTDLMGEFGFEEGKIKYSELKVLPAPPFNYVMPDNKMFIVGYAHFSRLGIDDGIYSLALDDEFLINQFNIVSNMTKNSGLPYLSECGYILDIDLDYFHTQKAVSPNKISFFSDLVKNAIAITIAKESGCVLDLREEGEVITSETLLTDLLRKINEILQK